MLELQAEHSPAVHQHQKACQDGVCVQTNTSSKVEMAAIRLADYGDKIDELVDSYVGMKRGRVPTGTAAGQPLSGDPNLPLPV